MGTDKNIERLRKEMRTGLRRLEGQISDLEELVDTPEPTPSPVIRATVAEHVAIAMLSAKVDGNKVRQVGTFHDSVGPKGGTSQKGYYIVTDVNGYAHGVAINIYSDSTINAVVQSRWPDAWRKASRRLRENIRKVVAVMPRRSVSSYDPDAWYP